MSELEPKKGKDAAPRHIPQEIVPVPIAEVNEFVREALTGTSLTNPVASFATGWFLFEPHLRYTAVDEGHTRIELDLTGRSNAVDLLMFKQRRAEIDRFFVALQDELDRREKWRPKPPHPSTFPE